MQQQEANNTQYHQEYIEEQKDKVGAATWTFLHTFAATYPHKPTFQQQLDAKRFIDLISQFYPCKICRDDFQQAIKQHPPTTRSKEDLSVWMCQRHNEVNEKLGKPTMECKEIWKYWSAAAKKHGENDENDDDCGFCDKMLGKGRAQQVKDLLKQ